jgi:hypothetical protein
MAAFGFTSTYANIKLAGIKAWKVLAAGDTTGNIDLGTLYDGRATVTALVQKNSKGQSIPYGADITLSAKMLGTHKTTVLELLSSVVGPAQHEIEFINGVFLLVNASLTHALGLGWRFDSSQDYDGSRYVEIMAKGKIILSGTDIDLDDLFGSAAVFTTNPCEGTLATWSAVGYYPAGFSAFEIRNAGETSWETLCLFRGGKLVCETLDTVDSHGRNLPYGVRFQVEADMLQSSLAELELLDAVSAGTPDFRATLSDGTTFTFADNCGVTWSYSNERDSDGEALIHIVGDGIVPLADWAGLVA